MAKGKTKQDAFKRLDKIVDDETKAKLITGELEAWDLHFGLGTWIRNNWIYQDRYGYGSAFFSIESKKTGDLPVVFLMDPDTKSTMIIEEYVEYLKQKNSMGLKEKKVLTLIVKQAYFDQIISGEKTQEFREVKPTTVKKLIELDEEGFEKEDEYGNPVPVIYDAIQFYVGYNKDRDSALVEVTDITTEMFVDENNELITYEYNGQDWVAEQVVYTLGSILEKDIHQKKK